MYAYINVCVYTYACIYICVYMYTYAYICIYMLTYVYICILMHTHTHIYIYIYIYIRSDFNKFADIFVEAFRIVVDPRKFSMLLLYIL